MRRNAFTILELLVVVTIIVILIAILLPALEKATGAADLAKCTANLGGIGRAMAAFHADHQDSYPSVPAAGDYPGLLGNPGSVGYGGFNDDTDKRPLNKYLGITGPKAEVKIARCPVDKGESLVGNGNAYLDWGTSYFAYIIDYSRVQRVYGYPGVSAMKTSQIRSAQNKVILPEWPMIANRDYNYGTNNERNRWHREEPDAVTRYHNVLYADSHAELTGFNIALMSAAVAADPGFYWW